MGRRNQSTKILVARLILREERQRVINQGCPVWPVRTLDGQQCRDNGLDTGPFAAVRELRRGVKPVAVTHGNRGKAQFLRPLGNRLRLNRTLQHRIG